MCHLVCVGVKPRPIVRLFQRGICLHLSGPLLAQAEGLGEWFKIPQWADGGLVQNAGFKCMCMHFELKNCIL